MKLNILQESQLLTYHRLNTNDPHQAADNLSAHAIQRGYDRFSDGIKISAGSAFARLVQSLAQAPRSASPTCPYYHSSRAIA
ncbi:hypothetical protein [Carnimonas bestiolae]|uniref:hypothetical protein n=1 Tax=Carnimonas bestiolae TaxID=3402172 RepID=UPI003EDBC25B